MRVLDRLKNLLIRNYYIDLTDKNCVNQMISDCKELEQIKKDLIEISQSIDGYINLDIVELYEEQLHENKKIVSKLKKIYQYSSELINKIELSNRVKNEVLNNLKKVEEIETLFDNLKSKMDLKKEKLIKEQEEYVVKNETPIPFSVQTLNDEIKRLSGQLDELKEAIDSEQKKYAFYWLKDSLLKLKKQCELLSKKIDVDDKIKEIKNLLLECEKQLYDHNKKVIIERTKQIIKTERYIVNKTDKHLLASSIKEDIKKSKREKNKLEKVIENSDFELKDRIIYNGIIHIMKSTNKVIEDKFPITLFKTEDIGFLASSIIVNNRIRLMRSLIEEKDISYIDLKNVESQLHSKIETLVVTKNIMDNTINQLDKLKTDIIFKYRKIKNFALDETNKLIEDIRRQIQLSKEKLIMQVSIEKTYKKDNE